MKTSLLLLASFFVKVGIVKTGKAYERTCGLLSPTMRREVTVPFTNTTTNAESNRGRGSDAPAS